MRAILRHEWQTVAMWLAAAFYHSCGVRPGGQTPVSSEGRWPGVLEEPSPCARALGRRRCRSLTIASKRRPSPSSSSKRSWCARERRRRRRWKRGRRRKRTTSGAYLKTSHPSSSLGASSGGCSKLIEDGKQEREKERKKAGRRKRKRRRKRTRRMCAYRSRWLTRRPGGSGSLFSCSSSSFRLLVGAFASSGKFGGWILLGDDFRVCFRIFSLVDAVHASLFGGFMVRSLRILRSTGSHFGVCVA